MTNGKKILRYNLHVHGLFGRNRKVKRETFALVKECDPGAPKTTEELLPLFRAKLAEIRWKGGVASISEDPITINEHHVEGKVLKTESYVLFSGRTVFSERLEGGGVTFTDRVS